MRALTLAVNIHRFAVHRDRRADFLFEKRLLGFAFAAVPYEQSGDREYVDQQENEQGNPDAFADLFHKYS